MTDTPRVAGVALKLDYVDVLGGREVTVYTSWYTGEV
jgi:hypothetical protein